MTATVMALVAVVYNVMSVSISLAMLRISDAMRDWGTAYRTHCWSILSQLQHYRRTLPHLTAMNDLAQQLDCCSGLHAPISDCNSEIIPNPSRYNQSRVPALVASLSRDYKKTIEKFILVF